MNEKLRAYIESAFAEAPQTLRTAELKEEIYQNLCDKYNDLIAEGKSEESAYNIAVASIGDVRTLIYEINRGAVSAEEREQMNRARSRSALIVAIAVGLYIVAVVPCILLGNNIGVVLMFVLAAVATGLLIYNGATRKNYSAAGGETVVEDFKAWQREKDEKHELKHAVSGALWLLITGLYFLLSFLTGAWHITWLVFLLGAALSLVISGIFDLKQK